MKKAIILTIIALFSVMIVGAQTTKMSEPTWQIVSEIYLPDTCKFIEGVTKNNTPKVHTIINGKKITINYNSYQKYLKGETLLVLVTSKKEDNIKYTIRQQTKNDLIIDIKYILHNYNLLLDIIYEVNPNLYLDILAETDPCANLYLIEQEYKTITK